MRKCIILFTALLITTYTNILKGQWQPDLRLTYDTASSFTTYNNAWCIASYGVTVHAVWNDYRDGNLEIYYKRSLNNGFNWGSDVRLTNNSAVSMSPSVATSSSCVYIVWQDNRDGNNEVYFKYSTDGGTTWSSDTRLTNNSLDSGEPSISVSETTLHIVWKENRDGNYEVYYKHSTDGGISWGADTRLTNNTYSSEWASISSFGSNVHIAWREDRDGNWEIYYKRSTDGGTSWGADTRLTNDVAASHCPSISASNTLINVVWYDNRDGNDEIYYKRSTNNGSNWGTDVRLTNNSGYSQCPSVSSTSTSVNVVWQDNRDGNDEIYYKNSSDGGANWGTDIRLTNNPLNSRNPSIYMFGTILHVIWYDNRDGNNEIYYKGNSVLFKANLNNVYRENDGRTQTYNITLSDSLCTGQIDSVFWYINDSLVGRGHLMTYPYKQGITLVKLKIKNNYGASDSTTATVSRIAYKRYTNGQILAGLSLIGDSIIYAVSTGDALYRLNYDLSTYYTLTQGANVTSSCSIGYDTTVFFATTDNNLYGYNKYGGPLWSAIPLGGSAMATPVVDSTSNRLYIGVSNNNFQAFNKVAGNYAWSQFLNAPIKNSAVVSSNRKLVVASAIGTVYGFNLNNPTPNPPSWVLNLNDSILVSPAIDTSGYFYFGSRSGKVYKISLTGTTNIGIVWQTPLSSAITSSPTIDANGNVYIGTSDGKFYSLNKNGVIRWYFQTPAQIKSTAAITTYQRIYFGNDAGEIYGLDTNKNVRFYYIDSAKVSCAMLHHNGTLYFGNEAGRIIAIYDSTGGTRGPVKPFWGTFQNNIRRTGNQSDGGQSIGVQKIAEKIPDGFELNQNYPNPFNPTTNIKYQIANSSFVTLKIYDILGRLVETLVNEKQSVGVYSVDFDGTNLGSGVYFYKIIAGEFVEVRKMMLIK